MNKEGFLRFWEKLINPKQEKKAMQADFALQFQANFANKVMQKIHLLKSQQYLDLEEIKWIFYRFALAGSSLALVLLIYTFIDADSLDVSTVLGLTNDFSDIFLGF
ncbi:MAG: hypothetical protein NW226_08150 [Microscillaceae bacterium]|nr:hypothetical protein [Microscillaceae bacterium]